MPFVKRFKQIQKKTKPKMLVHIGRRVFVFSMIVFAAVMAYQIFLHNADIAFARVLNRSTADTAMILIGLSFALSGICYFWDFADTKIMYRKDLGLWGFYFGVAHLAISLIRTPLSRYLADDRIASFSLGVVGIVIFAIMASVSNRYAVRELGGLWWRRVLRTGYIAYAAAIAHFILKNTDRWMGWMTSHDPARALFPPFSLITVLFATSIIVLRLALWSRTSSAKSKRK